MVAAHFEDLSSEQRQSLASVLANPTYELFPSKKVLDAASHLPEGATVAVTASPAKGMTATIDVATDLASLGFRVIPHLAARLTDSDAQLDSIIAACRDAGIERAFVVGGDGPVTGPFDNGLSLLDALAVRSHPFGRIGVPGYPEGHPRIPRSVLNQDLEAKTSHAAWVTTQMCFSIDSVTDWVFEQRRSGMSLPVLIGVPGVAEIHKLIGIAARIGVGDSARFLSSHGWMVGRLARPGGYTPDELLTASAPLYANRSAGVVGIHIYTFNQVETTERWRQAFLAALPS